VIQSVSIRNFMGIESLDLSLTAPLNFISGQNEAGKSSIRDAILWAFTGQARGLKTHADQAAMIREGEKAAEVHVILADGKSFVRRKTPKSNATISGEVPDIGLSPAILFDPYTFLFLPEAQRRELLFQVIPGLNPTAEEIAKRLFTSCEEPDSVPFRTLTLDLGEIAATKGFKAAETEAVTKRREAKRVKDSLGDAKEPEKILAVDGDEYSIPTLNFAAIEGTLKELQAQKDDLLRQKGAGEARTRRRDQIRVQLDRIVAMVEPPHEITSLEVELSAINESLQRVNDEIVKANTRQEFFPTTCPVIMLAQMPCPNAGQMVGQDPSLPGVIEALQQNKAGFGKAQAQAIQKLQEARRQAEEYRSAMERKAALEEEMGRMESEPSRTDLDTEIDTRERRITRGRAFQQAIREYEADLARVQGAQDKIATCDQDIILYNALAKALAPDGIPSQMIAEALDGINEKLAGASTYLFPDRDLSLTPDLNIVLHGSPFATLSKSAKFRVGIAFQYALARLAGARMLLIDEADILDGIHRTELINFLIASLSNIDQIMVFFTADISFRISDPRAQSWWLESGKIPQRGDNANDGNLSTRPPAYPPTAT